MKVVVTGGSGQLGTLVLERLVAEPRVTSVVSLDLVPPALPPAAKLEWRVADLCDPGLERHLEGADALVHLAFIVAGPASSAHMRAVNVDGSIRVFEAAARHAVRRIVYASSVAAYGILPGLPVPVVEGTPRQRAERFDYAAHKFDVEAFLDTFEASAPDLSVARLRPGVLLGVRPSHGLAELVARQVVPVVSPHPFPVVWDADVADAVVLALASRARGAWNVAAEGALTAEELARLAGFRALKLPEAARGAAAWLARAAAPHRGESRRDLGAWLDAARVPVVMDSRRARDELGWGPRYPSGADVALAFGRHARRPVELRLLALLAAALRVTRASAAGEPIRVHLELLGPRGGDVALAAAGGDLSVERGVPRPPDARVSLDAADLLLLLSGQRTLDELEREGAVRAAGDARGLSLVGALVAAARAETARDDLRGRAARAALRLLSGGEPR